MRALIVAALLAGGVPAVAQAQTAPAASAAFAQSDPVVERFLRTLQSGKIREGLLALASNSPLLSKNLGDASTLSSQIQTALTAYGPITGWERVDSKAIGTMLRRDTYIVQHRDMVTRWRFLFVRTGAGWATASFIFEDNAPTWFD